MKHIRLITGILSLSIAFSIPVQSTPNRAKGNKQTIEFRVDSVMKLMTLAEKIGQLNQYTSGWATGPVSPDGDKLQDIRDGKVGSLLNLKGVEKTRAMQDIAMQSRLKIPLIFGLDVIHGFRTTFPIPLAEAASWDMDAITLSARISAVETSASGIHWTFAPMVDIARDPRWGRVMEGAGEDTYLGCEIAKARVIGFQGKKLGDTDAVMACVKHFAAYGAAIGGRDYNSVDMSDRTLWEIYLPPFKAALDAGAATFMNGFNDLNGIPATACIYLQRDILKGIWGFKGFVVSDWGSIGQLVPNGFVKDKRDASLAAITAGSDMDMESRCYLKFLPELVKDKKVSISLINDAVRRILRKKFELGLFDNPYKFCDPEREQHALNNPQHRMAARDIARKSIVLLKNENQLLPLKTGQKVALIGPLARSKKDMFGYWSVNTDTADVVSQYEGLKTCIGEANLYYAKGCDVEDTSRVGFPEAIRLAKLADVVILSVGENRQQSGESKSRSNIDFPGVQEQLIQAIYQTGKPIVVLVNTGRPLVFNWTADHIPAILCTWWLGSEAGNAIADVLYGKYNPSGKLPMTFPRSVGQVPIYYNILPTGHPAPDTEDYKRYTVGYLDLPKGPRFPFGFGLSYTTFGYSDLQLSASKMKINDSIDISFTLTNNGKCAGEEVAQFYLRDKVASVSRPVRELKGFRKVMLQPGESKTIHFTVNKEKLSFYNNKLEWVAEPGEFDIMIGSSSGDIRLKGLIELMK